MVLQFLYSHFHTHTLEEQKPPNNGTMIKEKQTYKNEFSAILLKQTTDSAEPTAVPVFRSYSLKSVITSGFKMRAGSR